MGKVKVERPVSVPGDMYMTHSARVCDVSSEQFNVQFMNFQCRLRSHDSRFSGSSESLKFLSLVLS